MKTEDELDAKVAKLFDELTKNSPDGKVKKRLISDQETIAQMEREEAARFMEEACGMSPHNRSGTTFDLSTALTPRPARI
jgi:hypothetical protein